jgi:Na+-driven multidrug efflux pump
MTSVFFSFVYLVLTRIITGFGNGSIAALGIGHRIEAFSWIVCFGYYTAAATLVGQNLGAGHVDRAWSAAYRSTGAAFVLAGIWGAAFYLLAGPLVSMFGSDPAMLVAGRDYLRIIAFSQAFMALEFVLEGAFAGAGTTLPVMVVSVPLTFLRIPLGYYLAVQVLHDVRGIWWAISATTVIKGLLIWLWFRKGKWSQVQV